MAGCLIEVNCKINGASKRVIVGVEKGFYPDQDTAIIDIQQRVASYVSDKYAVKGEKKEDAPEVAAVVRETRPDFAIDAQ